VLIFCVRSKLTSSKTSGVASVVKRRRRLCFGHPDEHLSSPASAMSLDLSPCTSSALDGKGNELQRPRRLVTLSRSYPSRSFSAAFLITAACRLGRVPLAGLCVGGAESFCLSPGVGAEAPGLSCSPDHTTPTRTYWRVLAPCFSPHSFTSVGRCRCCCCASAGQGASVPPRDKHRNHCGSLMEEVPPIVVSLIRLPTLPAREVVS